MKWLIGSILTTKLQELVPRSYRTGALRTIEKSAHSYEAWPKEKTYAELTEHYSPMLSEVMQHFRFISRSRKAGESVAAYVAELRRLAQHCNYGDTLDKMLTDRMVYGINDEVIQKKLLQETDLTYARAISLAQGFETASKNLKEIHRHKTESTSSSGSAGLHVKTEPVHKVSGKCEGGPRVTCHHCGKPGHLVTVCRHRESVCHKCKKKGHLAKVSWTIVLDQPALPGKPKKNTG